MTIKIIDKKITLAELRKIAQETFGEMVKVVVDIEKGILAVGGGMHADAEAALLQRGSKQQNLWGINIFVGSSAIERIEFNSLINIRPTQGNRSMDIQDPSIKEKVSKIVYDAVEV